ncbi:hypothetical protein DL96DRAFT_738924 [Flagelloscypha sp. PMI_526]|nr:hypothetical protein DL96DRAFT_738924 [Flagelloscypha sp. PMI_526]
MDNMDLVFVIQYTIKTLHSYFLSNLIIILCYGIYLPVFFRAFLLISPRLPSSVPSRWLLALISVLFISTTVYFIATIFQTIALFRFGSAEHRD